MGRIFTETGVLMLHQRNAAKELSRESKDPLARGSVRISEIPRRWCGRKRRGVQVGMVVPEGLYDEARSEINSPSEGEVNASVRGRVGVNERSAGRLTAELKLSIGGYKYSDGIRMSSQVSPFIIAHANPAIPINFLHQTAHFRRPAHARLLLAKRGTTIEPRRNKLPGRTLSWHPSHFELSRAEDHQSKY